MNLQDFINNKMDEAQMEKLTKDLIHQQLDPGKRKIWGQLLQEKYGVEREAKTKPTNRIRTLGRVLTIAASIALVVVSYLLLNKNTVPAPQRLVQEYIQELPIMADQAVARKGNFEAENLRMQANEAYTKRNFETAIGYWETLVANQDENSYDLFYLGVSYLRQKNSAPEKTIDYLTQIQQQNIELRQEINWVLSLAYLQTEQEDKAKPILENIVNKQEFMAKAAEQLLTTMEKQ